jgi:hypothetical protein
MIITVYPSGTSSPSACLSLLLLRLALPTLVLFSTSAYVHKRQWDLLMAGLPKVISTQILVYNLGPYEGLAQASAIHRLGRLVIMLTELPSRRILAGISPSITP